MYLNYIFVIYWNAAFMCVQKQVRMTSWKPSTMCQYIYFATGFLTLNLVFKHDPLPLAGADFLGNVGLT